jgi:selenocysteine lyase/cysteine desulfurase
LAHGVVALGNRVRQLGRRLVERLRKIPGVELFSPENEVQHVGIVSLAARDWPPQELAAALDSAYGVQVRAGLHCAPRLHANLGTMASGGAVRFSPGPLTTDEEIDRAADAVAAIVTA